MYFIFQETSIAEDEDFILSRNRQNRIKNRESGPFTMDTTTIKKVRKCLCIYEITVFFLKY
jgi:hypothetical protein